MTDFTLPDSNKSRKVEVFLEECPQCKNFVIIYFAIDHDYIDYDHYTILRCPTCQWDGFRGFKIEGT
jgi:hypothetical protein